MNSQFKCITLEMNEVCFPRIRFLKSRIRNIIPRMNRILDFEFSRGIKRLRSDADECREIENLVKTESLVINVMSTDDALCQYISNARLAINQPESTSSLPNVSEKKETAVDPDLLESQVLVIPVHESHLPVLENIMTAQMLSHAIITLFKNPGTSFQTPAWMTERESYRQFVVVRHGDVDTTTASPVSSAILQARTNHPPLTPMQRTSPDLQSSSPVSGPSSAVSGPSSPRRGPPSPRRAPPSPRRAPPSPRRAPPSPRRAPPSPRRGPPSPRRGPPSPRRAPPSPRRAPPSPRRASPPPRRASPPPRKHSKPRSIGIPSDRTLTTHTLPASSPPTSPTLPSERIDNESPKSLSPKGRSLSPTEVSSLKRSKHDTHELMNQPGSPATPMKTDETTDTSQRNESEQMSVQTTDTGLEKLRTCIQFQLEVKTVGIIERMVKLLKDVRNRRAGSERVNHVTILDKLIYEVEGLLSTSNTDKGKILREKFENQAINPNLRGELLGIEGLYGCGSFYHRVNIHLKQGETTMRDKVLKEIRDVMSKYQYTERDYDTLMVRTEPSRVGELVLCSM